ncbi:ABC transporter substrate-binding protein, partial [Rhizobium johnstonii]|uniref:ABC transporter substrate-binding protein n=1 Tax=Rhizobium johnstonii TaxID=3019933 RepID=UPI003F944A5F
SAVPSLATEWRRIDDKTVELKLRQGVKFHNGDEMTAERLPSQSRPIRLSQSDELKMRWPTFDCSRNAGSGVSAGRAREIGAR